MKGILLLGAWILVSLLMGFAFTVGLYTWRKNISGWRARATFALKLSADMTYRPVLDWWRKQLVRWARNVLRKHDPEYREQVDSLDWRGLSS